MGETLKKRLMQSRFDSAYQEAFLNLLVAAAHVRDHAAKVFEPLEITNGQYNVLRILRGVHPEGYPRCEIARRMIERAPDLTRMIDRLVRMGLVERGESEADRRHSITRITRKGIDLLERLKPSLGQVHKKLSDRLTRAEAEELSRLLERLYGNE